MSLLPSNVSRRRAVWLAFCSSPVLVFAGFAFAAEGTIRPVHRPELDEPVQKLVAGMLPELVTFYKTCHRSPELSLHEEKTAARLAAAFGQAGLDVTTGVGGYGVVGVLKNGDGPTVLIRTDMDALPITEETGLPWSSKVVFTRPDGTATGVMHACGHDMHQTVVLGTARALVSLKDRWRGTLVVIGQPAEEVGLGSKRMIEAGLFERFCKPDCCLGLHVSSSTPAGQIGYTSGWAAANVDSVDITIYSDGGHGAAPHKTADPVVAAAHVVIALQTIVSRRVEPIAPAVITVGSIHGGTKHNVIPTEVKLQLTVRSYADEVRNLLLDNIRQITTDTCRAMGCPLAPDMVVSDDEYTPAGYNDPTLTAGAADVFRAVLGDENVFAKPAGMGGEDFGRYARHLDVPGFMLSLGSVHQSQYEASLAPDGPSLPSLHSSRYAPDIELSAETGIRGMTALTLSILARP